jgi:hypothetical protein
MIMDKRFLLMFITIVTFLPVYAQSYSPQQIELAERLHSLAKNAPPEMAYIQTNKDIYETGEDLWFKVYLLDAQYLIPSLLSKTLYLQLLNEKDKKAVWQEKYEIQDGFAKGRVYLESSLPEGDYLLTAYTPNSFFNDTMEFYAIRRIKVKTDITSHPLITAKFDKPYYNINDTIRINLSTLSEQGSSLNSEITTTLQRGYKKLENVKTTISGQGKAVIAFRPQNSGEDLQAALNIKYKDRTESLIMPIPGKGNPIQFNTFPEGGDLVSGIQTKLAFKAVNSNGEPVDVKGTLFEDNTPQLEFRSIHAGMGSFGFIPDTSKKYFIRLSEPAIDSTFLLPKIYPSGITLQLIGRDKESLSFKVSQNAGLNQEDIYIRVQCRGVVYGMTTAKLSRELKIKLPLAGLPQGIAEVTLFNSSLMPVAERLVYINCDRKLNIAAELSKEIYTTRGKATLKIKVKDENGQPVVANLGVTVFDKLYQNPADSNNILAHFYLSTQLKGRIYNPSFYFNSLSKSRDEALDLLMLTQGWRKYVWDEENLNKFREPLKQIIFDEIRGEVTTTKKLMKTHSEQGFVMAFSPNKDKKSILIPADSTGLFTVSPDHLKVWADNYIYLKPLASTNSMANIKLSDPFEKINLLIKGDEFKYPVPVLLPEIQAPSNFSTPGSDLISIKEVTIQGQKKNILRNKYLGMMDSLAKLDIIHANDDDYVCYKGILNCPNHLGDARNTKPIEGKIYTVYKDGNWTSEIYKLPSSVFTEEELLKMNNLSRVKAYYGNREFYKPNYDQDTENVIIPDFRNTLLWEPEVITDEKGEATLNFFCSDINTDFVGRIEGVSGEGLLGTGYFKFNVRKLKPTP